MSKQPNQKTRFGPRREGAKIGFIIGAVIGFAGGMLFFERPDFTFWFYGKVILLTGGVGAIVGFFFPELFRAHIFAGRSGGDSSSNGYSDYGGGSDGGGGGGGD